ncbi:MAG: nitroreductase [Cytophagales bacterium]|nr:nitroreductase [Cytophagales bacterium]
MQFDISVVNQLIQERRSIFPVHYSGEPVPRFIVEKMLENANWAPTHRFTEPWRFKVFTGSGIAKLATFQANMYKEQNSGNGDFEESKYEKLLKKPLLCSHIISIGMHRDEKKSIPEVEEIASVAMAVQNMYLTATAYGVGCYWGTGGVTYMEEAKPFFDLEASDKLLGFLYLGMPAKAWPKSRRRPIREKVQWVD